MGMLAQMSVTGVGAVSDEEFQALKRKVEDLEKITFPPEKSDEIKKVTEYVCPSGHAYSVLPKDGICPSDGLKVKDRSALIKVKLNRREEIGEKISGMMEEEFKKRVNVAVSGTGIFQHIADSLEPATKKQSFAQGSVDVYLLSRPMKNSVFFIDLESQGGQGPDTSLFNNSVLNNDGTSLPQAVQQDETRLREAWIQKNWLAQQVQFVAGKIDLTNYFDRNRTANDETSQFITGTLVNNPVVGNPPNGPGAVFSYDSRRSVSVSIGIQSPNGSGVNVTEQPYFIAEMDARFRVLFGWLGNYRFWGSRNGRTVGENIDDYSLGISADQEIGSHAIVFGRIGRSFKKEPIRDPHAWSTGVMLHNFLTARRRDRIGIGYSHYVTAEGAGLSAETESVGEAYYSVYLTEHLSLSPIGQFVFHSAGTATGAPQSNVLILGLRTQVYF